MLVDALAFLIQSQKEKVGSMCGSVGMGDGQGESWWLGGNKRTQEAQDTMCIQYTLATHWGRAVEGINE